MSCAKKRNKLDTRLLVNISKGMVSWAGLTTLCALPMLIDSQPVESYCLGCVAVGIVFPVALWAGTGYRDPGYVGRFYVNLFDRCAGNFFHRSK